MHIKLSPRAMKNAANASKQENKTAQQFVTILIEKLFDGGSVYMILEPTPPIDKVHAISNMINSILNAKEFFGFKLLTKEEAEKYAAEATVLRAQEIETAQENYGKEAAEEEENRGLSLVKS